MKRLLPGVCLIFFLAQGLMANANSDADLNPILGGFGAPDAVHQLSPDQVKSLLALAANRHWNVFDLLDEAGQYLVTRGIRVTIGGDDLRKMTAFFILGDHRVDTLLPLPEIVSLTLGARLGTGSEVEVVLSKPVSGYLELGDFALAVRYGFTATGDKVLDGAYGVTVKNGLFTGRLLKIARVPDPTGHNDPNFIAISIDNLFRPKRWQIDPVRFKPEPTPKP